MMSCKRNNKAGNIQELLITLVFFVGVVLIGGSLLAMSAKGIDFVPEKGDIKHVTVLDDTAVPAAADIKDSSWLISGVGEKEFSIVRILPLWKSIIAWVLFVLFAGGALVFFIGAVKGGDAPVALPGLFLLPFAIVLSLYLWYSAALYISADGGIRTEIRYLGSQTAYTYTRDSVVSIFADGKIVNVIRKEGKEYSGWRFSMDSEENARQLAAILQKKLIRTQQEKETDLKE